MILTERILELAGQITESRKNPEQNIHRSILSVLEKYKDDPEVFISFTELPKLGINPTAALFNKKESSVASYSTPAGIYTYPLNELFKEYISQGKLVPFTGMASNYVFIVKPKNIEKVLDTDKDANIQKIYLDAKKESKAMKSNTHITRKSIYSWTNNLIKKGYQGIIDRGKGVIHFREPLQALFFSPTYLDILEMYEIGSKVIDLSGGDLRIVSPKEFQETSELDTSYDKDTLIQKLTDSFSINSETTPFAINKNLSIMRGHIKTLISRFKNELTDKDKEKLSLARDIYEKFSNINKEINKIGKLLDRRLVTNKDNLERGLDDLKIFIDNNPDLPLGDGMQLLRIVVGLKSSGNERLPVLIREIFSKYIEGKQLNRLEKRKVNSAKKYTGETPIPYDIPTSRLKSSKFEVKKITFKKELPKEKWGDTEYYLYLFIDEDGKEHRYRSTHPTDFNHGQVIEKKIKKDKKTNLITGTFKIVESFSQRISDYIDEWEVK